MRVAIWLFASVLAWMAHLRLGIGMGWVRHAKLSKLPIEHVVSLWSLRTMSIAF